MEEIQKATHEAIELWQPLVKGLNGNYIAVLSDDSIDRDGEIVGKSALHSIMKNDGYTAILLNHKNDVLGQIGEWTNKRLEETNGHTAFVCEPKFYMSNPNAQIIKGCLDEGAQYGISIGAIPKKYEMQKINGKEYLVYTDLELLEASFVAIPANKHGRAMAVAKMFKSKEENKMSEELQKDFDNLKIAKSEVDKLYEDATKELSEVKKELESKVSLLKEAKDKLEAATKELEAVEELKKEIENLKSVAVMKGTAGETIEGENKKAEIEKALADGMLPVLRR